MHGRSGTDVTLAVQTSSGERQLLVAATFWLVTRRTPNTAGIDRKVAGGELDQRGYGRVGVIGSEITAPNIWAIW